jgi:hypothetical protein
MTPIIVGGVVGTTWGTWRRKTVTICGLIAAVTGAIVGVAKAAPILEPWFYTSHGYARDGIHHPLLSRIIEVQLDRNADKRQRLLDEAPKRELELQSEQAQKLPQYKALVQTRVNRIKDELKSLDEKDKSLFEEKSK